MVVMKMPILTEIPKYCDDCFYYACKPHPMKGWTNICELCNQCMDDDQAEDCIYDGNSRPKKCPLTESYTKDEVIAMLTNIQNEIQENQECANTGNWNNDLFSGGYDNGLDTSCDIIQEKIDKLKGNENGDK